MSHLGSFIWAAMWPNIFAPSFWTLLGIAVAHAVSRKVLKRHTKNQTEELKKHMETQLHSQTKELKTHVSAEAASDK